MRKVLVALLAITATTLSAKPKYNAGSFVYIDIKNTMESERTDKPVVIKMDSITSKLKHYTGQRICIFNERDKVVNAQFDDFNHDGKADEVVFLTDLKAGETKRYMARIVPTSFKVQNFEQGVYHELRHRTKNPDGTETTKADTAITSDKDNMYNKVYLHGMVFESAPIAYRVYFNDKQTTDVYGKITPKLEIPITKWHTTKAQLSQGYGDDILLVGNSVGVGTLKGWNGTAATHTSEYGKRTQRVVATGTLRNVMELEIDGWNNNGKKVDAVIRYIQYAKHRDVDVEVRLNGESGATFTTGVQRFPEGQKSFSNGKNIVASWGTGYAQKDTIKHPNKETVGLAVATDTEYAKSTTEDKDNYLVIMQPHDKIIRYHFQAFWLKEKNGFASSEEYFNYVKSWGKDVTSPLEIGLVKTF